MNNNLNLHIGQKVRTPDGVGVLIGCYVGQKNELGTVLFQLDVGGHPDTEEDRYKLTDITPIVRPLSSMTDEDLLAVRFLSPRWEITKRENKKFGVKFWFTFKYDGLLGGVFNIGFKAPQHLNAWLYLISKGFDVNQFVKKEVEEVK